MGPKMRTAPQENAPQKWCTKERAQNAPKPKILNVFETFESLVLAPPSLETSMLRKCRNAKRARMKRFSNFGPSGLLVHELSTKFGRAPYQLSYTIFGFEEVFKNGRKRNIRGTFAFFCQKTLTFKVFSAVKSHRVRYELSLGSLSAICRPFSGALPAQHHIARFGAQRQVKSRDLVRFEEVGPAILLRFENGFKSQIARFENEI